MPDDILISELSNAPQIDDSAVFPLTQDNGGSPATFKATMSQMAGKIGEGTTFANLNTTSKNIVGAINEVAGGGGGSTELIGTASGSIATFSDGGNNIPMKSCEVDIVAQQASGTPSPSNPLPITGFSSVNAVDCGINQWDEQWELGQYDINTGEKTTNNNAIRSKNFIPIKAGINQKVYFHIPNGVRLYFYDKDKNYLGSSYSFVVNASQEITFTLASAYYFTFYTGNTTTYGNNISINYPSTETQYHAYTGTTTPVSFGQTIYGGTAELVGGNGTKTWGVLDLSTVSWTISGNRARSTDIASLIKLPESGAVTSGSKAEKYIEVPSNNALNNGEYAVNYTNGTLIFYYDGVNSPTGLLIYPLDTPTTFTFTGANIPTLSGVNNVYADSGDVDLEYFNENADEIAELIRLMTRT